MRDRHVTLLDSGNPHFTMRHLIVATSRVTAGHFVQVPSRGVEFQLVGDAKAAHKEQLRARHPESQAGTPPPPKRRRACP
jgi:hypothetical protein